MTRTKSAQPGPSTGYSSGYAQRSSLSVSTWKLVVTPLDQADNAVEVTVEAENWLTALRRARKELGDEGGVPSGASCVMSATGEVTILDAADRRRYDLARIASQASADHGQETIAAVPSAPSLSPAPVEPTVAASGMGTAPSSPRSIRPAGAASLSPSAPAPAPTAPAVASGLVPIQGRDESPSAQSPLTYRERAFFGPSARSAEQLEQALRIELENLMPDLRGTPRGRFVNLAVFDHAFQDRPQRPPVATLQWKDWRGAPVFALGHTAPLPSWQPTAGQVTTSFVPPAPSQPPAASIAPPRPSAAPAPARMLSNAPAPVTVAPSMAPRAADAQSWLPAPSARESLVPVDPFSPLPQPSAPQRSTPPQARSVPAAASPFDAPAQADLPPHAQAEIEREPTGDQDRRLAVAFESCQELYFLTTPLQALEFAVHVLSELVPSEAASGCLYDINTDEFRFVALTGPGAYERRAEAVPSSAGLLGTAFLAGRESLVVADLESDPRYDPAVDGRVGLEATSIAYLPLSRKDHTLGMLQLINRQSRAGFSDADMAIAGYVAAQVAEFLQNHRTMGARR